MFEENPKQIFAKTYNFSDHDVNNFFLQVQKGVYP